MASANGAIATDASILALAPSSITQLNSPTVTANVTFYEVTTDYDLFGAETQYKQSDPIPAGFFATPLNDNWSAGLAIYSRTAADISIPQISVIIPLTDETRVRPITVSVAPTLAYRWSQVSFAATLEYLYTEYELYQTKCGFRGCNDSKQKDTTSGFSGALSATWIVNPTYQWPQITSSLLSILITTYSSNYQVLPLFMPHGERLKILIGTSVTAIQIGMVKAFAIAITVTRLACWSARKTAIAWPPLWNTD